MPGMPFGQVPVHGTRLTASKHVRWLLEASATWGKRSVPAWPIAPATPNVAGTMPLGKTV
jgi:hypothetical protein